MRLFPKILPAYVLCLPLFSASQTFLSEGPAPTDTSTLWGPGNTMPGALQAVAPSHANPNTLFVGGTNGGIWRTTNLGQSWTPLTDHQNSLSISSIVFDPSDPTGNTALAGIGITSNGLFDNNFRGGLPEGVLYTTNGGTTWANPGSNGISAQNVDSIFANGNFMLAGVFTPHDFDTGIGSLYKSTDAGANFAAISVSGNIGTEPVTAIATPPGDPNTIYVAITRTANTLDTAVYRTSDQGNNFTPIFTAADSNGLINGTTQTVLKLATGPNGSIAVGIVDTEDETLGSSADRLIGIFLSQNGGSTWTELDLSAVNADCGDSSCGFNPGGQGVVDSAIAIDPVDSTIVYGAGSFSGSSSTFALSFWQLQLLGANTISTPLITGTNNTQIHPDVRTITFSGPLEPPSQRQLLVSSDGGLNIRLADGAWQSINGASSPNNLSLFESYQSTYDANNNLIMTAAQDGTISLQNQPGSPLYTILPITGDGLNAIVNDRTSNTESYFYSSTQELGSFNRLTLPVGGSQALVDLTFSGDPITPWFGSPVALNYLDMTKIAFGGSEDVLITQDDLIGTDLVLTSIGAAVSPANATYISYGTENNPDALVATASDGTAFYTPNAQTTPLAITAYAGQEATDIVFDRRDSSRFFIPDGEKLWYTTTSGASFSDESGNFPMDFVRPMGIDFLANNGVNALFLGGLSADGSLAPFLAVDSDATGVLSNWRRFGIGLPNTMIDQLVYNPKSDSLLASAVGRGVWQMYDVTSNFPAALVLQFGLANNDSTPDTAILTGSRNLVKEGTGTLLITGSPTYSGTTTVNNGELVNNGTLPNQVIVTGANSRLSGTGTTGAVQLLNGAAIHPGEPNTIGDMTVASLDMAAGTHIQTTFNPTQISQLLVTGNATLDGDLLLQQIPGNYPAEGTLPFLLIQGTTTGTLSPTPIGGLPGFLFNIVQNANELDLHWLRFMLLNGISGNSLKFGNYINTYGLPSAAEQLLSVLSGDTLSDALEASAPTRNCIPVFIADTNVFLFRALTTHFSETHYQRLFDCCGQEQGQALWIDGFVNIASQDKQSQVPAFGFTTGGVVLGYDNFCSDCWTYGLAAGYAYDHFHEHQRRGSGHINTVFAAPYTTLYFSDFFAEAELLYAYNWIENNRQIAFADYHANAKSHFHLNQLMPHIGFGYDYCCCGTIFEPFAAFDWVVNWQDSYKEHGSDAFDVRAKSHTSSMLQSELGLRAYWGWDTCWGDLYFRAVAGYLNRAPFSVGKVSSTIIGFPASVTLRAFKHTQNLGTWGISALLKNPCGFFGMLSYDGEAGSGYLSNQLQLKLGMEF